jgi:hypothetical protein
MIKERYGIRSVSTFHKYKKSESRYYVKLMTQFIPFTQKVLKCTMTSRVDIGGME